MGVRGLAWFLQRHDLLCEERLSGCPLIIDGSNVYWGLYGYLKHIAGDVCQAYTQLVETFFYDLKRCNISPVVLLDGTYNSDCEKLPVLLQRMQSEIQSATCDTSSANAEMEFCKTLIRAIFIEVLLRMDIPFAVCPFEADLPVAALAQRLDCPVMTDDSDFFTLGVTCVRIPRQRAAFELRNPNPRHTSYFATCKIFHSARFLKTFNMPKELMPLVATLPGNDRFPRTVFDDFFERLEKQFPHVQPQGLKDLELLMRWLATQTSLELALKKVLELVREEEREKLKESIMTFHDSLDAVCLDFLQDTATMVSVDETMVSALSLQDSATSDTDPDPSPAPIRLRQPPALRQAMARGAVLSNCINAVYGLPWRLRSTLEDPSLPCSAQTAVPLLLRVSALLGTPVGLQVLFTDCKGKVGQLLASCTWRAPLLERVLLEGPESCLQTALAALQLRSGALAAMPPLLRLPAAALVVWRRATAGRSDRRQVRAVLLCLLALTPLNKPVPSELGLSPAAAADWRGRLQPLRSAGMASIWFDVTAMHLYSELLNVFRATWSLNEVLGRPLAQLDAGHTLHPSLTMRLGFASSDGGAEVAVDAEVDALVSVVADVVEASIDDQPCSGDNSVADAPPWVPFSRRGDTTVQHPDLRLVRIVTGVLNKVTEDTETRMQEALRELSVDTERGLYTVVDAVCRRAVAEPSEISKCADVCAVLADMQARSERGGGGTVRFRDLLLGRLYLGVGPACRLPVYRDAAGEWRGKPCRAPLRREDVLAHLDSVSEPEERWRQFGRLTDCWREAELRQLAYLQLLAAVIRRRLVPVWAARSCLERLLGGDGLTRQAPGVMAVDSGRPFTTVWSTLTPAVTGALQELLSWCNSDTTSGGDKGTGSDEPPP